MGQEEEEFYEPKRPKPQFDMKWLLIGFAIMVCLRGGVQLYIEFAKHRVNKITKSDDNGTNPKPDPRMEKANKKVEDAQSKLNKVSDEVFKVNQRLSVLRAKTKLTAEEAKQKDGDEKLASSLTLRRENAEEELRKANEHVKEIVSEKLSEGLGDVGTVFGAGIGIGIAYMVFAPFAFFLGGLIVGWKSPGNTIMEPALAAIGATIVITSWDFLGGVGEGGVACLGCSAIFSFMIALVGAMIGEKIQGPAAQVNININK
ncbi:MAG: hypothetical protein P1V97_11815 [Planctomycetota bacterium]|nr:hypothetical protein [Planctomycetota bacterium]